MNKKKHLDIGCGSNPRNPFDHEELYGVDILDKEMPNFNYQKCNVVLEKLPFDDSTFDSVLAYDFLEHIPRFAIINNETQFPFINFMNEALRVLKSGGILCYYTLLSSRGSFCRPNTYQYYNQEYAPLFYCAKTQCKNVWI